MEANQDQTPGTNETPVDAVLHPPGWHPGPAHLPAGPARDGFARDALGGPGHSRDVGFGRKLVTRSADDTLYFATGHPLGGTDRYEWSDGPGGASLGRLKPEAQ